jgi:UDP-glucose 4-epimerase
MVRPAARLEPLGWPSSIEVFNADLRSSRELERAFEGIDVLVHLAAVVSGAEETQFAGTVAGTERLLDAMAASACRRLVLCSSFSVYNYSAARRTLDENSPIHQVPDVYGRDGYTIAKWWQERVTRAFCWQQRGDPTGVTPASAQAALLWATLAVSQNLTLLLTPTALLLLLWNLYRAHKELREMLAGIHAMDR